MLASEMHTSSIKFRREGQMKDYYPDKHSLLTLILLIILAETFIWFASGIFIPDKFSMAVVIIRVAALTIGFIIGFIYFPLFFRTVKYTLTETEIIRTSGVFIKLHQSVRYSSIQYTTIISSPFSKISGFNFVIFFMFGGQLRLLFLARDDAEEIMKLAANIGRKE